MAVCCCSMAGTAACQHCRNNPTATDVWSNTVTMDHIEVKPLNYQSEIEKAFLAMKMAGATPRRLYLAKKDAVKLINEVLRERGLDVDCTIVMDGELPEAVRFVVRQEEAEHGSEN